MGGNPLNPTYKVAEVEKRAITPPRYMRDQMEIGDIEGAKPKKNKLEGIKTREANKIDDIEGTKALPRHAPRNNSGGYNVYDYSDITKQQFVSSRISNPLNPSYTIRDEDGNLCDIGEVSGSKPQKQHLERKDNKQLIKSLRTDDIAGAMSGSKGLGVFAESHQRKDYKQSNRTDDIEGAHSGSLKKAPTTNRISNPLDPTYDLLGGKEGNPIDAYGGKTKTDAMRNSQQALGKTGTIQ